MSARSPFVQLAAKGGILFGALFVVTVLLAAIPAHHSPVEAQESAQGASQEMDHGKMGGMDMDDAKASESAAVEDMTANHGAHSLHMRMTQMRQRTPRRGARKRSRGAVARGNREV